MSRDFTASRQPDWTGSGDVNEPETFRNRSTSLKSGDDDGRDSSSSFRNGDNKNKRGSDSPNLGAYRQPHDEWRRDASPVTTSGLTQGDINAIILGLLGMGLSGGIGTLSLQIAAAGLRVATMTAYAGAGGAAAIGTGYVVVKGGRLVIQQAKPGILMTIRAANKVARDTRRATSAASNAATGAIVAAQSGAVAQVQTVGNTIGQLQNSVARGSQSLMARLFGLPTNVINIPLESTPAGPDSAEVRLLSEEEARSHIRGPTDPRVETFIIQESPNGALILHRIVRSGDLGGASWSISPTDQPLVIKEEENEDGFVEIQAGRGTPPSGEAGQVIPPSGNETPISTQTSSQTAVESMTQRALSTPSLGHQASTTGKASFQTVSESPMHAPDESDKEFDELSRSDSMSLPANLDKDMEA